MRWQDVPGFLDEVDGAALEAAARLALTLHPGPFVEIGSYLGRSTVLLGQIAHEANRRVVAFDPHEGKLGWDFVKLAPIPDVVPTWDAFCANIQTAGLAHIVHPVRARAEDCWWWDVPTSLCFIDGLHDYANCKDNLHRFGRRAVVVAVHDYNQDDSPDVVRAVDEFVADCDCHFELTGRVAVLRRLACE